MVYTVQMSNLGNVHLKFVSLNPVTNSSTNGMNTTFPMDCGGYGVLPMQINVADSVTCTSSIEFTTPVSTSRLGSGRLSAFTLTMHYCYCYNHYNMIAWHASSFMHDHLWQMCLFLCKQALSCACCKHDFANG